MMGRKDMNICKSLMLVCLVFGLAIAPTVEAGWLGKAISRSAMKKMFRMEAARDATTVAKPLVKPRTVYRYTSSERAAQELKQGLAPERHMTSVARRGRPLSPEAAQRRYGLLDKPDVRETIRLPQGFSARHNRVFGGEAGLGEITSPQALQSSAIRKVVPLK
jgi:hypothetical protein